MTRPPSLYTIDILNQPQGPFAEDEVRALADEHEEVLVYDAASDAWLPIGEFRATPVNADPDRALAGRATDARDGGLAPRQQIARAIEEILGICRGLVADGVVNEREAVFLDDWCRANPIVRELWPVAELVDRIRASFTDGVLRDHERRDLERTLRRIVGAAVRPQDAIRGAGRLPLDLPEPSVSFPGKRFVLTGEFLYGDSERVRRAVTERGGIVDETPDLETDYVIVGAIGGADWQRAPWGATVTRAERIRAQGGRLGIIAEDHWSRHLRRR